MMMSSMAFGSTPARRTTSGSTAPSKASGGVLTSVPLNERPIAVRTAPTMTGSGMRDLTSTLRRSAVGHATRRQRYKSSRMCSADGKWCPSLRLRHVEMLVTQAKRLLRSDLGPGLHEVELTRRELQVGAVRMEQVAGHFLTLVGLALLDQPERFLRDDDAV